MATVDDKKVIFSMVGVSKIIQQNQKQVLKNIYLSFFYGAKIGIIGLGLIGGSLAKTIKKHTEHTVYGYDIDKATMSRAKLLEAIDGELSDNLIPSCDYVFLALYPKANIKILKEKAPLFAASSVVIDCGGIKKEICEIGRVLSKQYNFIFIGGHPMAGREVWGFRSAISTLFKGASMILTPEGDIDIATLARTKAFFLELGFGSVTIKTPADHDRIIAHTSQLAHVLSSSYIRSHTAAEHRGLSAGSFKDMTRVATLNDKMWTEIFLDNKKYLLGEIDELIKHLSEYREALDHSDEETLTKLMQESTILKADYFKKL